MMRLKECKSPNIQEALDKIMPATLNDIAESMNKYTKYLSGDTEASMGWRRTGFSSGVIYWTTEYAAYAYYKGKPSKPGRHLRWAEYAARTHGKEWGDDIKKRLQVAWKQ